MQTLWKRKIEWDEPLDKDLSDLWLTIAADIQTVTTTVHPRSHFIPAPHTNTALQLHVFSDASTIAYGSVAFISYKDQVTLVMSRSRVAPLKPVTLPKLELMAAVTGTRLASFVKTSLISKLSDLSVFLIVK